MYNGIHINRYVKRWLTSNQELLALCPKSNMAPLVISPSSYPTVTWMHGPIEPDYTKDGVIVDKVEVEILIVSDDYEQAIDIAAAVRKAVEYQSYSDNDVTIPIIKVDSISEDAESDAYIQSIVISFEIESEHEI